VAALEQAVNLAPEDAFYHFRLGDLLSRTGEVERALPHFTRCVQLAPHDDYYQVRLGCALMSTGDAREAIRVYLQAVKLDPHNASYQVLLADAYEQAGDQGRSSLLRRMAGMLSEYEQEFVTRRRAEYGLAT